MKTISIIILTLAVLAATAYAQEFRGAEIGLQVSNQVDRSTMLVLGVREGASSGLDLTLEEYELPPVPPNEIFDARVISTPGQSQLGLGGTRDYRAIESTTEAFTWTYTVAWQCGEGSSAVLISWEHPYPARIGAMTIDGEDMAGKDSWSSTFTQGQATVRVTFNYRPLSYTLSPASLTFDVNDRNTLPSQDVQLVTENAAGAAWMTSVDVSWLVVEPAEGNGDRTLTVRVINADMPVGNYSGTLSIRSPVYPAQTDVPVTLSITVGAESPPSPDQMHLTNYPNPFTRSTRLDVRLPPGETATLRVYDALGRCVADLTPRLQRSAALQRIIFPAGALPPGMYTCRLESAQQTLTRSMLLLK
ncbi:MAG: T9SS type A sorting domain-containing protein [Bacteroidota bacterium]|nr:T9SS type A sorting domain-containing protein [Bacteroidota bacterium]